MSASLFGGSFKLVKTDDQTLKNMFIDRLKSSAINHTFPFLKYLPFMPKSRAPDMVAFLDNLIARRREIMEDEKIENPKDIFQIFIDNMDANPDEFTIDHLRESMILFM